MQKCIVRDCTFFGNPDRKGYCSKCFQIMHIEEDVVLAPVAHSEIQRNKNCNHVGCRKKLKMTSFEANTPCVCKNYYCSDHRVPDVHACTFDYKMANKTYLTKTNEKIEFAKVAKI